MSHKVLTPNEQIILCNEKSEIAGICVLELDEIHSQKGEAFSYKILVNEEPIYVRTMEPISDAICPCFIKMELKSGDAVTIQNNADTSIRFAEIFLHKDLTHIKNIYLEPMEFGLCFPRFTYSVREKDLALMKQIKNDFSNLEHFTIAIGIEIKYMLSNDTQLKDQFEYIISLAEEVGVNLLFNFNTWWDGTPDGRDGKGGYFNDVEYQQVVYDPITGKKMLSIPNLWRNTPWYTMNHDHLNKVRKVRLKSTLDILGKTAATLRADKTNFPTFRIFIDNEPTYWSEYAYTASPECGGDFNEYCIAAAKKDGIDLNPNGAVTEEQKEWLFHNLSTYMTDISKAYHEYSSLEYGIVTSEEIIYGDHFLTENIFTHTMAYSGYPFADGEHLRYETHVNPWTRLGVECHGHQDERVLSYMNSTGRFAQVNAERCCYTDSIFHRQFYSHGAVCDIIFNFFYDSDKKSIRDLDKMTDLYVPDEEYGTPVMTYRSYDGKMTGGSIIRMENMEVAPLRERRILRPKNLGKGYVIFSIGTIGDFVHGGWVELTGLVRPANGSITASVGFFTDNFYITVELLDRNTDYAEIPYKISLNKVLSHSRNMSSEQPLYLRLDFESLFYDDWAQMNAIWKIRSVAAFENSKIKKTLPLTLEESRTLALMVSYRIDCRRLLKHYDYLSEIPSNDNYKEYYQNLMHRISVENTHQFIHCRKDESDESKDESNNYKVFHGTFLGYDREKNQVEVTTHSLEEWNWQSVLYFDCSGSVPVELKPSSITGNMLDHISSNPYTPAAILNARIDVNPTIESLKRGDAVTLTLHDNTITEIQAVRGLARGKITDIQNISLSAPMHNPFLTIETAPESFVTFELGIQTHLNYERAHAENPIYAGALDLELKKDSIVLISFEPEKAEGRAYRALEVTIV